MNEKSLEPKDLKCVAKAVYRRRRKTYPPLPTSQPEAHENLQKMNIETNRTSPGKISRFSFHIQSVSETFT
jgi:hypothetical protein